MSDDPSDRAAIEALIQAEDDAWTRGDAAAFSKAVLTDCVFTNIFGAVFTGHAAFETQHTRIFATVFKGTSLRQRIAHLRFLRPDVAVVDTEAVVSGLKALPPGTQSPDGALHTRLLQVLVKQDGTWWIAAYHNVDVKPPPAPA
ncbi:MAG: SgcJ/EcaC family oxidoreductase [Rhizomicrobium sp.]